MTTSIMVVTDSPVKTGAAACPTCGLDVRQALDGAALGDGLCRLVLESHLTTCCEVLTPAGLGVFESYDPHTDRVAVWVGGTVRRFALADIEFRRKEVTP